MTDVTRSFGDAAVDERCHVDSTAAHRVVGQDVR